MSEPVKEVRVLRLRPGDAVYVESPHDLTHEEALRMAAGVREWLVEAGHRSVPVMLLSNGHQLRRIAAQYRDTLEDGEAEVFMIGGRR